MQLFGNQLAFSYELENIAGENGGTFPRNFRLFIASPGGTYQTRIRSYKRIRKCEEEQCAIVGTSNMFSSNFDATLWVWISFHHPRTQYRNQICFEHRVRSLRAGDLDVKPRKWQSARHLYFSSYLSSFVLPPSKRLSKGVKLSSRQMPCSHRWWALHLANELIKHSAAAPPLLIKRLADLNYCH